MLVFCIKQLLSLKRAIVGRREPHQLAWGMALGVWLGTVPYGSLVALAILLFILSVRVNHGMVAVSAVVTSVIAARFDAQTHAVGKYILTHPHWAPQLSAAWQWPLVPWTDLNNTVVMGGLLLGLAAVVPTYLLSFPLFRYLAPPAPELQSEEAGLGNAAADEPAVELVDTQIEVVRLVEVATASQPVCSEPATPHALPTLPQPAAEASLPQAMAAQEAPAEAPPADPPVSEALNYLLRQLQDSRQRRAA